MDIINNLLSRIKVTADGCFEWQGYVTTGGYGSLGIGYNKYATHRLSWEAFRGPIPAGMFVCHHCDNRRCINPAHLFLGRQKENNGDAAQKGRMECGSKRHLAKLHEDDIMPILDAYDSGVTGPELAERYGVAACTMMNVVHGRTWKHVSRGRTGKPQFGSRNYSRLSMATITKAVDEVMAGRMSLREASIAFGLKRCTVYAFARRRRKEEAAHA